MKSISVTIGIPAYNEVQSIRGLLTSIKNQKLDGIRLDIILISDGSTDDTLMVAKSLHIDNFRIIEHHKRHGIAKAQNEIASEAKSELLLLLNADIRVDDSRFVQKIVEVWKQTHADLISTQTIPLPPSTFIDRSLSLGM